MTDFPYRPMWDRVLIKRHPHPVEEQARSIGIVLPETAKNQGMWGTVVAVGPGSRHHMTNELVPVQFEVGQTVQFLKYSGTEVSIPGDPETYISVKQTDIVGTM